jgi:ATP-dependent helicase/nuclease subunit A
VSLIGTLRSPFCCLSDETLFLLSSHPAGVWAALHDPALGGSFSPDQQATALRARSFLDRWRARKDRLPVARLLGEVFADSGYDAALQFEFLGDRKLANLWKLVDLARIFDRSGRLGLDAFIRHLAEFVGAQPREEQAATQPESADVVRLMTIHQAKGLEFPVVFLPDFSARPGGSHHALARWHRRLGCVVRPPMEEEPLPFSSYSWDVWKAAEVVEDWAEELRTLYVACTRAQDYLVLSASIPDEFPTDGPWTIVLSERFDARKGNYRASGHPAERIPVVRVTESQPSSVGALATARPSANPAPQSIPLDPGAAAPLPVRLVQKRIFTVSEIEAFQQRRAASASRPEDSARQTHADDLAAAKGWPSAVDSLSSDGMSGETAAGALTREVLRRWVNPNPGMWETLLDQAIKHDAAWKANDLMRVQVADMLKHFALSRTFRMIAQAEESYRDVEFSTPLSVGDLDLDGKPLAVIRGVSDCLLRGNDDAWHVVAYLTSKPLPDASALQAMEAPLALAARALEQSCGTWPRSVQFYSFAQGAELSRPADWLRQESVLAGWREAIKAISGLHLAED